MTDRIVGISAILISLLTLVIFIYQTNIMHEQSRLSVTPRLLFGVHSIYQDSLLTYNITLENKGIGPAIVEKATAIYQGKTFEMQWEEMFSEAAPELGELGEFQSMGSVSKGTTLSADEEKILISYQFHLSNLDKILESFDLSDEGDFPFDMEIIYRSIYESERWSIKDGGNPVRLD